MLAIGFTIPLAAEPEQCFNQITPNDMYSSTECAWSGAFIVAGGLSAGMWVFIRALSMNVQICWDIVPGRKFFYYSQALGWGVPAVLFTATMTVTGVSFRFGKECDVNHQNSMKDFWGPLMGFIGAAALLQLITFAYCLRVYLRNLFTDSAAPSSNGSTSGLPSHVGSTRTQGQAARVVMRRVKKVLWLQWRGIAIVTIMLVNVIFFSVVFVWLDSLQSQVQNHFSEVEPWLECLALHPTDKNACLPYVGSWIVNESTVVAVLLLLSFGGIQIFMFVARPSLFPAWKNFVLSKFTSRQEFISLDARPDVMRSTSRQELVHKQGRGSVTFEMQKPSLSMNADDKVYSPTYTEISSPGDTYRSPSQMNRDESNRNSYNSNYGRGRIPPEYLTRGTPNTETTSPPTPAYNGISLHRQDSDYFTQQRPATSGGEGRQQHELSSGQGLQRAASSQSQSSDRRYRAPTHSFSAPRNSSTLSRSFDPRETYSRGGLALNPPSEVGESEEDLQKALRANKIW